jgi:UDP-glucose 4-epimerase
MALLITGGTGFIGSAIARLLLENGHGPVVLFDLFPNEDNAGHLAGEVSVVRGDFAEATEVARVIHDHEISDIFHLGYLTGEAEAYPARAIRTNCEGTNAVFECALAADVRRVLWPSSAAVYGATVTTATPRLLTEEDPVAPDSLYGACKLFNEHVAERHAAVRGLDHAGLRLSSIAGPGRGTRRGIPPDVYANIIERPLRGEPVTLPPRDHVLTWGYVADAALAFYQLYLAERPPRRIYNFAGPQVTVGEVTDQIRRARPEARFEHGDEGVRHLAYVDASRLADDLGFTPAYSAQDAIAEALIRTP